MRRFKRLCALFIVLLPLVIPLYAQDDSGPIATVSTFLTAWGQRDSVTMYRQLARQSQEAYPEQVFVNRYTVANDALALSSLTFEIVDTHLQGVTAAVTYNVTIESSLFGQLVDNGRIMRLVNEGGRWGVAWSSMDIFAQLPSVAEITSTGQLPPRANIYDRDGELVAGRGTVITLYTSRQQMANEADCIALMARLTRRLSAAFERQFASYNIDTIFNLGELNSEDYEANRDAISTTCGVNITLDRQTRTYYGNNAMSHVAGYTGQMSPEQASQYAVLGYNSGDLIGQAGVENVFERRLAGTSERVLQIVEPGGTVLRAFASQGGQDPVPVQMTIDRDLQRVLAQAMADAYDYAYPTWGGVAADGAAIILDVKTGAILAMVSYPLFDPLLFDPTSPDPARRVELLTQVNQDERRPLINHVTQSRYTPGSVYKLVTAVAVLNEELVAPDEIFDCQLRWFGRSLGDEVESRPDWRETDEFPPAGPITPAQAIMASCNPFFWEFGARLYNQQGNELARYAERLGMGEPYNVFPGAIEAAAELDNPASTSLAINNTVGQGSVSIPPIQLAVMTATIANGGTVYKPYIVKQVGGMDGTPIVESFEPQILNQIDFKPGVLEEIKEGMCGTTTEEDLGTAYSRFRDAPYWACGKTGTAQTARYPNAWFTVYAPADDPQIAITVVVSQSLEGSQVAAPIVRRVLDYYFNSTVPYNYPDWWPQGPYVPLNIPVGSTGG